MTFKKWLLKFVTVDLPIGDLAREDVANDPNFPDSNSYNVLIKYLQNNNAADIVIDVFERTWKFYRIEYPILDKVDSD